MQKIGGTVLLLYYRLYVGLSTSIVVVDLVMMVRVVLSHTIYPFVYTSLYSVSDDHYLFIH